MNAVLKCVGVPFVVALSIAASAHGASTAALPVVRSGPVQVGPPDEQQLTKASGRHFDLRNLPATTQPDRVSLERKAPPLNPIAIDLLNTLKPELSMPLVPQPNAPAPAPTITFDGLDFASGGAGHPPDTNGDVGPAYYIQTINQLIGVFRKSDGVRVARFSFNTFMSQGNFGNVCDGNNFGDPVVVYDSFEDRWVITDFAFQLDGSGNIVNPPGTFQCFAVSMTGDPVTGGWNYYSFPIAGGLGDVPKLGIWPDGLYMSVNMYGYAAGAQFQNARLYAFNKAQMYAGSPTVKSVSFDLPSTQFTLLPSNARLQTGTPPAGTPNYFVTISNFLNAMEIWKFHVDWDRIPLSTMTGPLQSVMAFYWAQYSRGGLTTAPSPANALDTRYFRLMPQNQYSNIGGVESLWASQTAGAGNLTNDSVSSQSAVRYYQVGVTGGTVAANTTQSFTYSPDAAIYRFMPSAAVNRAGDLAIGYTTSNATTNPSLKYAGRLATDPVNSISLTEQTLFDGSGTQSGTCQGSTCERWGRQSAMTLDPDGCTFWYTNEYYAANGINYQTRIGSFAFPSCTPVGAGGTISGTVTSGGSPVAGATVQLGARKTTTTNASGFYSISGVPAGTYPSLTASYAGYTTATASTIPVTDGATTTRNFALTAASSACSTDTTQADFQSGVPANVDLTATPGAVVLAKPDLLDQTNPTVNPVAFGFNNSSWVGQTFTPALSGQVVRADVNLGCFSSCSGVNPDITISIRATTAGPNPIPTGADLATATLVGFNDGGLGGLKSVTFGTPFTVTAGTRYALVIRAVAARTAGVYGYTCSCASGPYVDSNPYANGQIVASGDSGGSWGADTTAGGRDMNFRLFVNAGYLPTGALFSGNKDSAPANGMRTTWSTLTWTATTPASTSVKFQVGGSNNANGPFNFVGPDGTAATFFTTSPASMPAAVQGLQYLQYKATLASTLSTSTPTLNDVTACFTDLACGGPALTITKSAAACTNSTGNTASVPAGSASYAWTIANGTITTGAGTNNITYTAGASGNVTLTVNTIESSGCHRVATADVPIDIVLAPTITPAGSVTFCFRNPTTLTSSSATGNQWYAESTLIPGATNQTLMVTKALMDTYSINGNLHFSVKVTDGNGCSGTSAPKLVTVLVPGTPQIQAGSPTTFCAGLSVALQTTVDGLTGKWYRDGVEIPGETGSTYYAMMSGSYTFVSTFYATCPSDPSNAIVVTVNPSPAATITPGGPTTFCDGGSVTLNSSSATSYQWNFFGSPIAGQTGPSYIATANGLYSVTVTDANGCSATSAPTSVTVNPPPPQPTITPGPISLCAGGTVMLTSSTTNGNQWNLNGNPIPGETGPGYIASTTGVYTVTFTHPNGCSATSAPTSVTVHPIPAAPVISSNSGKTNICVPGGTLTLTSSAPAGNHWYRNGVIVATATGQSYDATDVGDYTAKVTDGNGCTSLSSNTVHLVSNTAPALDPIGNQSVSEGSTLTFTIAGSDSDNDALTYSASNLPGGASFNPATREFSWTPDFGDAGSYGGVMFSVSDGCVTTSQPVVITVDHADRPPVLDAIGSKTATVGVVLTFTVHATDADAGDTVTYSLNNLPNGASFDTNAGAFSWTPTIADVASYTITFTADDGHPGGTDSETITISVPPLAPTNVDATATSSTSVAVSWTASAGATSYEVLRRGAGESYSVVGTSGTTSFPDNNAMADHAYLYAVRALNDDGDPSPNSVPDLATTVIFTDPIVQNTTTLHATQIYRTRFAVNALRELAGIGDATFTDTALENVPVKSDHITELRTALNEALDALGFPTITFTDSLTGGTTPIKALHVNQVRDVH